MTLQFYTRCCTKLLCSDTCCNTCDFYLRHMRKNMVTRETLTRETLTRETLTRRNVSWDVDLSGTFRIPSSQILCLHSHDSLHQVVKNIFLDSRKLCKLSLSWGLGLNWVLPRPFSRYFLILVR